MKKIGIILCVCLLWNIVVFADNNTSEYNFKGFNDPKGKTGQVPEHGGWLNRANGIEGRKVTFGFQVGGVLTAIDANKKEACNFGGKANVFVYAIIPKTKTFAIGVDLGAFYLKSSADKFAKKLSATQRDGSLSDVNPPIVNVGDWLMPTAMVSFMGNFHPLQRFNIQIKLNLGAMMTLIPANAASYIQKDIQTDGTYKDAKYEYAYDPGMKFGFAAAIGTDLLYALGNHSEFKVGLDWSFLRFTYYRTWKAPVVKQTKELTQFGIFGLHAGFAFNF